MMALYVMEQMGHEVPYLVNIIPKRDDSWVFHTPNLHLIPMMAEAMGKDLVQVDGGVDESEDLAALESALRELDVEGVVTGALASDYQWDRINRVCEGLGLKVMSPLWRKDQDLIVTETVDAGIVSMIVAVMADGLDEGWLGVAIDSETLVSLRGKSERYGISVAGEGGEYETLTLDSPIHNQRLIVDEFETDVHRDSAFMGVTKAHLGERKDRMNSNRPA